MSKQDITRQYIEVTKQNLPLTCPMPKASLWDAHPRVGIQLNHAGEAKCPYCGTLFRFVGELPKMHH